jgi:hypothetical protein
MKDFVLVGLGQKGGAAIVGTSSVTANANGYFYAIQFITSAIVSSNTIKAGSNSPSLASITAGFSAGTIVYGQYEAIKLSVATASAIGYYGD